MSKNIGSFRTGLLLPHFGQYSSRDLLLSGGKRAEELGFDGVWGRDHAYFRPHGHEGASHRYIDSFVMLSAVAAITHTVTLGLATLIPQRHPIQVATLLSSLEAIAGDGRVQAGWGVGSTQAEFDALGMGDIDRRPLVGEQVRAVRALWSGENVSFTGDTYSFDDVTLEPRPPAGRIPMWYGGPSRAAVRRAVEYCDGWIPPRMPRRDYVQRITRMTRLSDQAGRKPPVLGLLATVVPAENVADGLRFANLEAFGHEMDRMGYTPPPSGRYQELQDFDGALIVGNAADIAEQVAQYRELGVSEFVFDLRLRLKDWTECVEMVGREVLPLLA